MTLRHEAFGGRDFSRSLKTSGEDSLFDFEQRLRWHCNLTVCDHCCEVSEEVSGYPNLTMLTSIVESYQLRASEKPPDPTQKGNAYPE